MWECHNNDIADSNISVERKNDPVSPSIVLVETSTTPTTTHKNHHNSSIENLATTLINHHPVTINNSTTKPSTPCGNKNALSTKENNLLAIPVANSCSTATSENGEDNLSLCEGSIDSLEVKMWHKSETESVAPSCSSLSMDSSTDEAVFEFMRRFVTTLFTDSLAITLEFKHQFGQYALVSLLNYCISLRGKFGGKHFNSPLEFSAIKIWYLNIIKVIFLI